MTDVTKQLHEMNEAERELNERIKAAVEKAAPVVRDPRLYARDRRAPAGRTR